jgi:hypothetical protein
MNFLQNVLYSLHVIRKTQKNIVETEAPLELWSMVDTMSPQYVFYWIAVGNKKLPIQKVVCKIEKVEWRSCIQNTKLCI